jgi:hypothetical protein
MAWCGDATVAAMTADTSTIADSEAVAQLVLRAPSARLVGADGRLLDRALAELPLVIEFVIDVDGVEADLVSSCRSQYRTQRAKGTWRILRITSIYETDTLTPRCPEPSPTLIPPSSPLYDPPVAGWPSSRTALAAACAPTSSETTNPNPSRAGAKRQRPGSPARFDPHRNTNRKMS